MAKASTSRPKPKVPDLKIITVPVEKLKPFTKNPREHSKKHVADLMASVSKFGLNAPLLCDENFELIAGHGTLLACKELGFAEIPVIVLQHLTEAEKFAFRIAHNRLCENGGWNIELLVSSFELLTEEDLDFDLSITGFETAEIDIMRIGGRDAVKAKSEAAANIEEVVELIDLPVRPVSRIGDRYTIAGHVIVCGDARDIEAYKAALGDDRADLVVTDPPYNTKISNNVSGRGKTKHQDFVMGCGEMSPAEFQDFIADAAKLQAAFSKPGAYNCMFTGWYSLTDMLIANQRVHDALAHMCIWAKTNGGFGAPWRNAWEGLLVYRVRGGKAHNNVQLGKHGRNRTDVFSYAGVNTFRAGRMEELEAHPTCKPTALLADLILDISPIRGIVLDAFLGSGASILAAHEARRRGVGIELDPKYVDVAITRIEKALGEPAIHDSGLTFTELGEMRHTQSREFPNG